MRTCAHPWLGKHALVWRSISAGRALRARRSSSTSRCGRASVRLRQVPAASTSRPRQPRWAAQYEGLLLMKPKLLPLVWLCAACAAGGDDGEEVVRRDSAGVVIVEHAEVEPRSTWRLTDAPALRIESNEADTAELLYGVAG